ncbi:MAG: hypothetical protein NTY77_14050 [Elusimicrobia bacterium]|nr:hypothetical protein [Elusimicrobiota bacterium]
MSDVNPDFSDFVAALNRNHVEFVIVGAFSLAFLGYPRATGDIDLWIRPTASNAEALLRALEGFGFKSLGIARDDILSGKIIQLGYPPVRIDLLTKLDGVRAEEIWVKRQEGPFGEHAVFYLDKDTFLKNKRASGRPKDLVDLELFDEPPKPKGKRRGP